MKKRTKQVQKMVDEVNSILRENKVVRETSGDIFWTMQYLLLKTSTYMGYNWFYDYEYTDVVGNTTTIKRPCGTGDYEKIEGMHGYLQLY